MAVYAVRWNRLHPSIFLSASVDWTLRVWDERAPRAGPPLTFDLGDAVGDAAWAPFSSTVMAAVTDDGRVHVFDLAANRLAPLCVQKVRAGRGQAGAVGRARAAGANRPTWPPRASETNARCSLGARPCQVVRSARLTKLAFNAAHPVLLVGDSKGTVTCLKLSPNLRRGGSSGSGGGAAAAGGGSGGSAARKGEPAPSEVQRLDMVLEVARKGRSTGTGAGVGAA